MAKTVKAGSILTKDRKGTLTLDNGSVLDIVTTDVSPCTDECPLGTNVKAYVSLIAAGRFAEALDIVRQTNPFPGICGRVCTHPCESACRRNDTDEPLAIAALKRFLADYELQRGIIPRYETLNKRSGRVAVIGAGPAGLTCAADCARMGYDVTVFEALGVAGGMLAVGIPAYRLPREILALEIKAIEALGVKIQLNSRIGETITLDSLKRDYNAVCIATGAHKPAALGVDEEAGVMQGIISWVDLLKNSALDKKQTLHGQVVVVGGGNTAIDAARVALRSGADKVCLLYRRSRAEMPALAEEVDDACEEGVEMQFLCAPVKLQHTQGRLTGITCVRMGLGPADASGRPRPVPIQGSEFTLSCDLLIPAVGQQIDSALFNTTKAVKITDKKLIQVDPQTYRTSTAGIFAAGDAVLGAATVVEAIATGHKAAQAIHCAVSGAAGTEQVTTSPDELTIWSKAGVERKRVQFERLGMEQRRGSFEEVNRVYTEFEAIAEAQRCERCGPCTECESCVGICEKKQLVIELPDTSAAGSLTTPLKLLRVSSDLHETVRSQQGTRLSLDKSIYQASVFTAVVDEQFCRGCGLCEEICPFHAIRVAYRKTGAFCAQVDTVMCRGCGKCVAVCPSGALDQNFFTGERIRSRLFESVRNASGRIVVFTCFWNGELKKRLPQLPAQALTVMCRDRIGAGEILDAFEYGAAGVIILGCSRARCHYAATEPCTNATDGVVENILPLAGIDAKRFCIVNGEDEPALKLRSFLSAVAVKR